MKREDMLARLLAQAGTEGSEMITLRAIVEEASDLGAVRVLERMGLADEGAHEDLAELRELLRAWRADGSHDDDPRLPVLLQTVNGIAAGLQTTG